MKKIMVCSLGIFVVIAYSAFAMESANQEQISESAALINAVESGHEDKVRMLLGKGANTGLQNKDGNTALTLAVWKGRVDIVIMLLEKDADVDL